MSTPTLAQYTTLASAFCPIFKLHSAETFYPCSAEFYLENANLYDVNGNLLESNVDVATLLTANTGTSYLVLNNATARSGQSSSLGTVPIYCIVNDTNAATGVIQITYAIMFANTGASNVPSPTMGYIGAMPWGTGSHDCGFSRVTLQLTQITGGDGSFSPDQFTIQKIFYGSSRTDTDGYWQDFEIQTTMTVDSNGINHATISKPYVYVGVNSHGMYANEGVSYRNYLLDNDYMDDNGIGFAPNSSQIVLLSSPLNAYYKANPTVSNPDWINYNGYWSQSKLAGLNASCSFLTGETSISTSAAVELLPGLSSILPQLISLIPIPLP